MLGQARGAGATTIVRALAVEQARANKRTLMIDLALWTVELSASYHQSHANKLVQLAEQYWNEGALRSDAIEKAVVPCQENLSLLPNNLHWLASSYLGGMAGYDFICALFDRLSTMYDSILVDLGAAFADPNTRARPFLPACAAHVAAAECASRIFHVFAFPSEYEKWRAESPRVENPEKVFLLINRAKKQRRELLTIASYPIPLAFVKHSNELDLDSILSL
ncbi:MAG TPA: hypothetical protein VFD70_07220 [Anaerolineae bacterium]|nr:hypothetical protein [Anaerolineae bacterium]